MTETIKFEIEVEKKEFDELKNMLIDMDCEFKKDEEVIEELFFINDFHGNEFDIRDKVKVKRK